MFDWIYKLLDDIANGKFDAGMNFRQMARFRGPSASIRMRVPHSNKAEREAQGIPHGYPGAKLARMAMEKRVTLRG